MKFRKPGLRIFKTFLAVMFSMLISYYRPGEGLPFFSAIAAIICLQQDVEATKSVGLNRMLGTILGGLCGLLYLLIMPKGVIPIWIQIIIISLVTAIIIWIMALAEKPKATAIMAIVFLSIAINHGGDVLPFEYSFNRTFDTLVGVVVAMAINWSDFAMRDAYRESKSHKIQ